MIRIITHDCTNIFWFPKNCEMLNSDSVRFRSKKLVVVCNLSFESVVNFIIYIYNLFIVTTQYCFITKSINNVAYFSKHMVKYRLLI